MGWSWSPRSQNSLVLPVFRPWRPAAKFSRIFCWVDGRTPRVWWCFVVAFLFQMYYYIHMMCVCVCAFYFCLFLCCVCFLVDIQIDEILWTCWTSTRWTAKISTICSIRWKPAPAILHPWCLTWNLKISPWKRMFLLNIIAFFKFQGSVEHCSRFLF